jgi:hypothetical protein
MAAALMLGLAGCAQVEAEFQPPPVSPSSPIARYAETVSEEVLPTPTFQDVPPKPTDIREPSSYKAQVVDEIRMRRALTAWRISHPPMSSGTEAWAVQQRNRIPVLQTVPVNDAHDAESAAFARRLREEAVKPQ